MMIGALLQWSMVSSESESGGIAASSLEKSSCVAIWNTIARGAFGGAQQPSENVHDHFLILWEAWWQDGQAKQQLVCLSDMISHGQAPIDVGV